MDSKVGTNTFVRAGAIVGDSVDVVIGKAVAIGLHAFVIKTKHKINFFVVLRLDLKHGSGAGALHFGEEGFPGMSG